MAAADLSIDVHHRRRQRRTDGAPDGGLSTLTLTAPPQSPPPPMPLAPDELPEPVYDRRALLEETDAQAWYADMPLMEVYAPMRGVAPVPNATVEDGYGPGVLVIDGVDSVYFGTWQKGLPHGDGKAFFQDLFSGEWRAGMRDGRGTAFYDASTTRYQGLWRENVPWSGTEYTTEGKEHAYVREGVFELIPTPPPEVDSAVSEDVVPLLKPDAELSPVK